MRANARIAAPAGAFRRSPPRQWCLGRCCRHRLRSCALPEVAPGSLTAGMRGGGERFLEGARIRVDAHSIANLGKLANEVRGKLNESRAGEKADVLELRPV